MEKKTIFDWGLLRVERQVIKWTGTGLEISDSEYIAVFLFGEEVACFSKCDFGDHLSGKCMGKDGNGCHYGFGYSIFFTNDGLIRDVNLDPIPDDKLAEAFSCKFCGGAWREGPRPVLNLSNDLDEALAQLEYNKAVCMATSAKAKKKMGFRPVKIEWDG